ncbi:hypothetical protein CEUSTIGMA_g13003.t1 [Chlamydomonas eustigma]|uniref:AAA+ ATPase domain-containing protein n=1 Tax=Chlamydomonas eustigma TaxID=1157962 RepID=A0A250XR99_9CHLO|nr:hypothetical protein CEUSTIGMA_g13003.t1 [Chlamydomonas eustigma]|eukprot:GAX85588.1 hypothetical protein CEUSTIGMA_g13003.t1 [Chlamydomonas eustigma]
MVAFIFNCFVSNKATAEMIVEELQSVLDLVVSCIESEDAGFYQSSIAGLQQAHTQLTYAKTCCISELDADTSSLLDQVCQGFLETYEAKIKQPSDNSHEQHRHASGSGIKTSQASDSSELLLETATDAALVEFTFDAAELPDRGSRKRKTGTCASLIDTISNSNISLLQCNESRFGHIRGQPRVSSIQRVKHGEDYLEEEVMVSQPAPHLEKVTLSDKTEDVDGAEAVGSTSCSAAESLLIVQQCQRHVQGSMEDVSGLEDVKQELRSAVLWPLKMPEIFRGYRQPAKTFLLVGPPGTGKTMLVEKLAAEAGLVLLSVTPSSVLSKWSGESEKAVRSIFAAACALQPSIVFLDEVDALAGQRTSGDDAASRRLLTELLIQLSSSMQQDHVFTFACTNRIQDCDTALLRRFERRILIPYPDFGARQLFFHKALHRPEMEHVMSSEEVELLVAKTQGTGIAEKWGNTCETDRAVLPGS